MLKHFFYFFFTVIFSTSCLSQNYEFYGIIKLHGKKENAISYKLVFTEKNGKVNGYSITDLTGEHETKNIISGTYDAKSKSLAIKEKDIVYTKSKISDDLFCFVNLQSQIKLTANKHKMEGSFKGMFKNNTKCIDGTFELVGTATVEKLLNKVNKHVQKSKKFDEQEKTKYNPVTIFDSLQTHQLEANQNLNIFTTTKNILFEIWDNNLEDGDEINLYHNNEMILSKYKVSKDKKIFKVALKEKENIFKIEAVNQGKHGLNTAMVSVVGDNSVSFLSNLKALETTSVSIIRSN